MSIESDRLKKIENIIQQGVNPYPAQGKRTHSCQEIDSGFEQMVEGNNVITLAGRLVLLRLHGKACFANIEDFSGRFQFFLNQDDSKLFSWFLFNKLGFSVKVGLNGKHVEMIFYSKKMIYATPYYMFGKNKFYVISQYAQEGLNQLYTYEQNYPEANKELDLSLATLPTLALDKRSKTLFFKEFNKDYSISFDYNQNLLDFMATYPQADYGTFFNAPVDLSTYKSIALALKKYIDGMKASDAINFILHFVQNAFRYQTDDEQFNREKVMFAQETLYFDKSDCEDRAILFAYLVKNLLNISVEGVKYKDHMATALAIPIQGDSVKDGARRLVIADPTYIHANIGQSMPKYKSKRPESFIRVK